MGLERSGRNERWGLFGKGREGIDWQFALNSGDACGGEFAELAVVAGERIDIFEET